MKIILINFLTLFSLLHTCNNEIIITSEESKIWKEDTLGCLNKRTPIYSKIRGMEKQFLGVSKKNIERCFGEADETVEYVDGSETMYYFVEGGPQCTEGYTDADLENWDLTLLYFFIENKKVGEMGGMMQ